jgi:hypothetical protein
VSVYSGHHPSGTRGNIPVCCARMRNCVVLHVEDDDAMAFLFRAALDEAGVDVSVYRVSDGEQALSFVRNTGV